MEKYDEIINAINMINKQAYNKTDNVLKDLMRFILQVLESLMKEHLNLFMNMQLKIH